MYRNVLMMGAAAVLTTLAAPAATAQSGDRSYHIPMATDARSPLGVGPTEYGASPSAPEPPRVMRPNKWQVTQLVRWGEVGKCVAAKDREGSLTYVAAARGTDEARAAAARLDPVFAGCFVGAGIANKGNKGYRRAAIADALAVRLAGA
jgi:hypothetical protein